MHVKQNALHELSCLVLLNYPTVKRNTIACYLSGVYKVRNWSHAGRLKGAKVEINIDG